MVRMSCVRNSAGSLVVGGPLSISTGYLHTLIPLFIIVVSLGQTGLTLTTGRGGGIVKNQTLDTSESQSTAAALALLAQWAKTSDNLQSSSSSSSSLGISGIERGNSHPDFITTDLDHFPIVEDESHGHDLYHHYHPGGPVVHEKGFSLWDFWAWLRTDTKSVAVPLILFGVIPILLGLIPFIVIFTNFWFIFNKIHGLHTLFLSILGLQHDDDIYGSYGNSYGWSR